MKLLIHQVLSIIKVVEILQNKILKTLLVLVFITVFFI